ncbi:hypothetical protein [Streptomyces sp. NPDC002054]|uniref:hypothetical protein n=1 Tax=Streptomyces sp. NPDC002054 TaxID=3154663 RepID=UPI0033220D4A
MPTPTTQGYYRIGAERRREAVDPVTALRFDRHGNRVWRAAQSPDLKAHLADLLRSRERLMSAFEADDWARTQVMPSNEEISHVRRLIDRVTTDLDQLTAEDRAPIEQAVALVRRSRTVHLGMPRVGRPLPDVRPPGTHQP